MLSTRCKSIRSNLPQSVATHPICNLLVYSANRHAIRTRGGGFPSRKLFEARFTDHRFSLWHAILLDSSQRSSWSSMPFKFSNSTVERDTKSMLSPVWDILERKREKGRFDAHANGGLPWAGTRTESCNGEDLRIWRHARSVGILVAAWLESRWDQTLKR